MRLPSRSVMWLALLALVGCAASPQARRNVLGPGDHRRTVQCGGIARSYLVHVPASLDPKKPAPVVLAFHGAATNADFMASFSGLSAKSDAAGFVVVYPNGTGVGQMLLAFNAMGWAGKADDVAFTAALLDDLAGVVETDPRRIYATGHSNGAMMCYRLACELPGRIAAIAPVGGTMPTGTTRPSRAVPVMHFHGTEDGFVPFEGPVRSTPRFMAFLSVEATVQTWVAHNGSATQPTVKTMPTREGDPTRVTRRVHGGGRDGSEVVLFTIEGGGHTWPGGEPALGLLGKTTQCISANDLMWKFFQRHPMR